MKKPVWLLLTVCPLLLVMLSANRVEVNKKYRSIQDGVNSGAIHLKIQANGKGFSGNCIEMDISNSPNDSGYYKLEAGRRLKADDSTAQDILVTKDQYIPLAAGEKKHLNVFGFCCQEHHHAPMPKSGYSVGNMADKDLVSLARFLNNNQCPLWSMQEAVWSISDNNALSSVENQNMDSVIELRNAVAGIKHITVPWYSLEYEKDTAHLFSGRASRLSGVLTYYVPGNELVNVSVFDQSGTLVKTISDGAANPDTYSSKLSLDVKGWAKGKYIIRVSLDGNKGLEKMFEL